MAVYVGLLLPCVPNKRWRWNTACHMFADTAEELHAMALRLNLKFAWFQCGYGKLPHYDLTPGKRRQAIRFGCVEADRDIEVKYIRQARKFLDKPNPPPYSHAWPR